MDSNGVRLILIVLGVALLVAIYLWDRLTRRSKSKAPRKLKRKPRERREPGVVGPAPDIDDADEWRVAPEPVEDEPPVAQPEPAKERGLFGRSKRAEKERERLIAELQEANEKLQSIDKMKTNFITMASHELRTPLTTIKAFVELLIMKQGMPDAQKAKLMNTINTETDRLTRLVADLLDLARIEAGSMRWQVDDVSIEDLIRNVIESMALLFENKGLRVTTTFSQPLARLAGDRDRLIQVMTNILSNSVKFTPAGGSIHIAVRQEAEPREQIVVEISDTGIGIPAVDLELIFEKFHRSDNKVTDTIEGTGLGLAITRQIVEHYGGRIWASSMQGEGSVFTVTLPLQNR